MIEPEVQRPEVQGHGTPRPGLRDRCAFLWTWTRVSPALLAVLLVAHLAFGIARFPFGSVQKRVAEVAEWRQLGADGWPFRLADEETRRIVRWLGAEVHADQLVAWEGERQGSMQLLAPVLFPALLVLASAPHAWPPGREVFRGRAPWSPPGGGTLPVVVATRDALRLEYR